MEIKFNILSILLSDSSKKEPSSGKPGSLNLTHIQLLSNLSYDKTKNQFFSLAAQGLIELIPLKVTKKGLAFIHECKIIRKHQDNINNNTYDVDYTRLTLRDPVSTNHKIKDMQQVINICNATIQVLSH